MFPVDEFVGKNSILDHLGRCARERTCVHASAKKCINEKREQADKFFF